MADSALSDAERRLLGELTSRGVRFLLVGAGAAVLQGANTATQDLDLWFEDLADQRIPDAARAAGGFWVPGGVAGRPPAIGGPPGERVDVVVHMHGLSAFAEEWKNAIEIVIDDVTIRVLPLERILASKRAAGRTKDQAQIPALEEALAVLAEKKRDA